MAISKIYWFFCTLSSVYAAAMPPCAAGTYAPQWAGLGGARRVALRITLRHRKYFSGIPIPVAASFINHGRQAFSFPGHIPALLLFTRFIVLSSGTNREAAPTREAAASTPMIVPGVVRDVAMPGQRANFWEPVYVSRFADMTQPGKYLVRLMAGKIKSNWLSVRIVAPPTRSPDGFPAISISSVKGLRWIPGGASLQIRLRQKVAAGGMPSPLAAVFFCDTAKKEIHIRLSGDVIADCGMLRVRGPDGIDGDEFVKKPTPHWMPIPNKTPVPLTAYGRWLAKQKLPQNLKWKTYTLKPGIVYKYAVPLNIGCRFDLSLSGVYRVRLGLMHGKARSPWAKIIVPQN